MAGIFYLARADGTVIGKFSEEGLLGKISAGDVSPHDQYLAEGGQWLRVSVFPGAQFPGDFMPPTPPKLTAQPKKKSSPDEVGALCALIAAFAPLVSPLLFLLLSLPLLLAAFVLAIV